MRLWYHPESECYFRDDDPSQLTAMLCVEVYENELPEHARKELGMTTIESTAVRVNVGDDAHGVEQAPTTAAAGEAGFIPDDKLVRIYIKIRDAKSEFVKAHEAQLLEKYDAPLKRISAELLRRMQDRGNTTGLKTPDGTVYLAEDMKVSCQDWGIFYDWIKKNNALDFLEQRVKAGEVKKYMEGNGGALPPGISVFRQYEARVRKPTKRGEKAVGPDQAE